MKKILFGTLFIAILGTGGALYYTGYFNSEAETEDMSEEVVEVSELYLALDPPFVVNFTHRGTLRYLQVSIELMYNEQEYIDLVDEKMPAVRNALILLFSDQNYETLSTLQGKEELRNSILLAVNDVIGLSVEAEENSVPPGQVYLTNFVMQ